MNYLNHIKTTRKTLSSILNNIVQNSLSHGDIAQLNAQIRQFETLSTEIPAQLTEDAKTLSLQFQEVADFIRNNPQSYKQIIEKIDALDDAIEKIKTLLK